MNNLVKLNEREVKLANIFWPGIGDDDFTPEGYALLKKYEKKVLEWCKESEHVKKSQEILHDSETCKENGDSLTYSESDDLEEEATRLFGDCKVRKGAFYLGAKWKEEQFEKNRLAACDAQTKEEAEREMDFMEKMIKEEHRQPTYSDAINYGMRLQKDLMMKDAIDAEVVATSMLGWESFRVYRLKQLNVEDKVKIIIIKED